VKKVVSVVGGRVCSKEVEKIAQELGRKLAKVADILVSGGLSGVMEAVCSGFKAEGGLTIGILPSYNKADANKFVDIAIPTGLGLARNVLVVKSADVVVALPGRAGDSFGSRLLYTVWHTGNYARLLGYFRCHKTKYC